MNREGKSRVLPVLALVLGLVLAVSGLVFVGFYVVGVLDIVINQPPDRSWLFWGLGLAFPGVLLLGGGVTLLFVWWRTRTTRDNP